MNDVLLELIFEARRLNNLTVRDVHEVEAWHRAVDKVLRLSSNPAFHDRNAEYNTPAREAHRKLVRDMFKPRNRND